MIYVICQAATTSWWRSLVACSFSSRAIRWIALLLKRIVLCRFPITQETSLSNNWGLHILLFLPILGFLVEYVEESVNSIPLFFCE